MPTSFPASMLNQKPSDLGILNRFKLDPSRSSSTRRPFDPTRFTALSGIVLQMAHAVHPGLGSLDRRAEDLPLLAWFCEWSELAANGAVLVARELYWIRAAVYDRRSVLTPPVLPKPDVIALTG